MRLSFKAWADGWTLSFRVSWFLTIHPRPEASLPSTAYLVGLRYVTEVAGELVNGKEPPEHDVPGQTEEVGRNAAEPLGRTLIAAQPKQTTQSQQKETWSHDANKLEAEAQSVSCAYTTSWNMGLCKFSPNALDFLPTQTRHFSKNKSQTKQKIYMCVGLNRNILKWLNKLFESCFKTLPVVSVRTEFVSTVVFTQLRYCIWLTCNLTHSAHYVCVFVCLVLLVFMFPENFPDICLWCEICFFGVEHIPFCLLMRPNSCVSNVRFCKFLNFLWNVIQIVFLLLPTPFTADIIH